MYFIEIWNIYFYVVGTCLGKETQLLSSKPTPASALPYHADLWVNKPVTVVTELQDVAILQIVDNIIFFH